MVLHCLSAAPTSASFSHCLRLLGGENALLLLGDGVYAALTGTHSCNKLLRTGVEIYVLEQDAIAAGILNRFDERVNIVNFDDFVALTEQFPRQLAWY